MDKDHPNPEKIQELALLVFDVLAPAEPDAETGAPQKQAKKKGRTGKRTERPHTHRKPL